MLAYIDWTGDPSFFLFIQWYNVFFSAGFIIGFFLMKRVFQREGSNTEWLEPLLMYLVIATVLGARPGFFWNFSNGVKEGLSHG